jgi:hypothetical protein
MTDDACAETEPEDRDLVLKIARESLYDDRVIVDLLDEGGTATLVAILGAVCREVRRTASAHDELVALVTQVLPGLS